MVHSSDSCIAICDGAVAQVAVLHHHYGPAVWSTITQDGTVRVHDGYAMPDDFGTLTEVPCPWRDATTCCH